MKCKYKTEEIEGNSAAAKPGEDFKPVEGELEFGHNETVKEIKVEIISKDCTQRDDVFRVRIFDVEGGAKLSKKDGCIVEIVHDDGRKRELCRNDKGDRAHSARRRDGRESAQSLLLRPVQESNHLLRPCRRGRKRDRAYVLRAILALLLDRLEGRT